MKCACGANIHEGAKFCGKCGKPVPTAQNAYCSGCGAKLHPGAAFCGKCGARVSTSGPRTTTPLTGRVGRLKTYVDGRLGVGSTSRSRAKHLLIVIFVIAVCIAATGISGRLILRNVSGAIIESMEIFDDMGDDSVTDELNKMASRELTKFVISLIRNDSSGYKKALNGIVKDLGMSSDFLVEAFSWFSFSEMRDILKKETGGYWPLLQIMAYNDIFLTVGLIAAVGAVILWYLLGGHLVDLRKGNVRRVLYIGYGWIAALITATITGIIALKNIFGM